MKAKSALANCAWIAASVPAWRRFTRSLSEPRGTQLAILRRLLRENVNSAHGIAHRFGEITRYEDFCSRVPLVDYEDLQPWIERIMRGETSVLTNSRVTRLVPTSGSTGGRKLIPFTAPFQREFNRAIGPWMVDLARQHPGILWGPAYWSVSPALSPDASEVSLVPIGFDDDTEYVGGARKRLIDAAVAAPSALRSISDPRVHRYATLLSLLREVDLRLISVWHPSFFALLLEAMAAGWEDLLEDVAQGTFRYRATVSPALAAALASKPQHGRARSLRRGGPEDVSKIWPHLRSASCWGDAQARLPFDHLRRQMPSVHFQSKGLLATEGVVSIPFQGRKPVAICSHFYEFEAEDGRLHLADALQLGETYSVVLTTSAGLWRYRLGDQVEVDGFVGKTPSLRFKGRGRAVSDLCGEKLHESFVTEVLLSAFAQAGLAPPFAVLAPEHPPSSQPHYALFIEGSFPDSLLNEIEIGLRANPHYAHCRDLRQLNPVVGCALPSGAYDAFSALMVWEGQMLGNVKPSMLSRRLDLRAQLAADVPRRCSKASQPASIDAALDARNRMNARCD